MPKAFCICVISVCQQMTGNFCIAWQTFEKSQCENACILYVSSKYLLPDLKTKQLRWQQLQKINQSCRTPRLVTMAAPVPRPSSLQLFVVRADSPNLGTSPCCWARPGCSARRGNWLILAQSGPPSAGPSHFPHSQGILLSLISGQQPTCLQREAYCRISLCIPGN